MSFDFLERIFSIAELPMCVYWSFWFGEIILPSRYAGKLVWTSRPGVLQLIATSNGVEQ